MVKVVSGGDGDGEDAKAEEEQYRKSDSKPNQSAKPVRQLPDATSIGQLFQMQTQRQR